MRCCVLLVAFTRFVVPAFADAGACRVVTPASHGVPVAVLRRMALFHDREALYCPCDPCSVMVRDRYFAIGPVTRVRADVCAFTAARRTSDDTTYLELPWKFMALREHGACPRADDPSYVVVLLREEDDITPAVFARLRRYWRGFCATPALRAEFAKVLRDVRERREAQADWAGLCRHGMAELSLREIERDTGDAPGVRYVLNVAPPGNLGAQQFVVAIAGERIVPVASSWIMP